MLAKFIPYNTRFIQ